MKRTLFMIGAVTILVGGCATSPSLQKPEKAIPKAETRPVGPTKTLMSMAGKIAASDRLGVSIRMGYDVVQPSGQKIAFQEQRDILLDRPNRLRSDVEQSDGDRCGNDWYQRSFSGSQATYIAVPPPAGY